jgi:hypothetical protein
MPPWLSTAPLLTQIPNSPVISHGSKLNPKSEIETGDLPQSFGHKRIVKTSTDRFGYASIFSIRLGSNILRHLAGLNFGFRVKARKRGATHCVGVTPCQKTTGLCREMAQSGHKAPGQARAAVYFRSRKRSV